MAASLTDAASGVLTLAHQPDGGLLKFHWIQAGEDDAEGVVARIALVQFQAGLKPGQLAFAESSM